MIQIPVTLMITVLIVFLLIFILLMVKVENLDKRYKSFISKFDDKSSIEETLKNFIEMVNNVNEENKIIKSDYVNLERKLKRCTQKIGIVRYNAFDDVGSNLSFALAMLDEEENGIVINAIYGRTSSNVYAKSIENGNSKYTLSEEEVEAISKAKLQ